MEKIEITRQQYKNANPMGQTDPFLEEKMKASEDIIKLFKQIFNSKHLKILSSFLLKHNIHMKKYTISIRAVYKFFFNLKLYF